MTITQVTDNGSEIPASHGRLPVLQRVDITQAEGLTALTAKNIAGKGCTYSPHNQSSQTLHQSITGSLQHGMSMKGRCPALAVLNIVLVRIYHRQRLCCIEAQVR